MGRWQARIATAEKNADTLRTAPFKTLKTPCEEVSRVLRVHRLSEYENFFADPKPSDATATSAEWEERAAVLEYDEGLTRDEAERLAGEQAGKPTELRVRSQPAPDETGFAKNPVLRPADSLGPRPTAVGVRGSKTATNPPAASPALRPPDWRPEPGFGVRILRPAVEVPADEYDRHLDVLIAALPEGSAERNAIAIAKHKGWCVERNGGRIFTRGRF